MTRALIVHRVGPSVTLQDLGRPGYLAFGLSRGGAVDRLALYEGAALLGQGASLAALEMAGMGGEFEATEDTRIALTGAQMKANIDGDRVAWNASHLLPQGARLSIGAGENGNYGYLHVGGGFAGCDLLGSRSTHLAAGIGGAVAADTQLKICADRSGDTGLALDPDPRFDGGEIRIVPSLQTEFFSTSEINRFEKTSFHRDIRANRMGARIMPDGEGFHTEAGLSILSEVIVPGDVQVTGDGTPFVLLAECQTTGGYPRIGSILPADLPRIVQAGAKDVLRFKFITLGEAVTIEAREAERRKSLRSKVRPLVRDPADIGDLLSYQLISGMITGQEAPEAQP